jgi:hypothetical protein
MATKLNNIIIEILIVLLALSPAIAMIFFENSFSEGLLTGGSIGLLIGYLTQRKSIAESENPNANRILATWHKIMILSGLVLVIIVTLYITNIFESAKPSLLYLITCYMLIGNYRSITADENIEMPTVYLEDEDIRRKTFRYQGKIYFFGGILSIIAILVLPLQISIYILVAYIISSLLFAHIYSKREYNKKYV